MDVSSYVPERISAPARHFLTGSVLNGLGNGIFGVCIQLYLVSLGFDGASVGSIIMMNAVGAALLTVPVGFFADRFGRGRVFVMGLLFTNLAFAIMLTCSSFEMLSLAWLMLGLGNSVGVLLGPIYSSLFDEGAMDRAFGFLGFVNVLSAAVGSLLGFVPPMLVERFGFSLRHSYWSLLSLAVCFFLLQIPLYFKVLRSAPEPKANGGLSLNLKSKWVVLKFSFLYMIQNFAVGAFISLFPFYVNKKFGVQSDALGALYFVAMFVQAGVTAIAPMIAKRLGTPRTVALALACTVPFWLMFPLAPGFIWVSMVLMNAARKDATIRPRTPTGRNFAIIIG